jgi:hypothetical protein
MVVTKLLAKADDLTKPAEPSIYFWERGIEQIRGEFHSSIIMASPRIGCSMAVEPGLHSRIPVTGALNNPHVDQRADH